MSIKPILFSTEMVQTIQNNKKAVTRRLLKPQPDGGHEFFGINCMDSAEFVRGNHCIEVDLPFVPGDILWVRETCDNVPASPDGSFQIGGQWYYKADGDLRPENWRGNGWTPSIHMPKAAARIFLLVTNVWVERLQNIDEIGAKREGFEVEIEYIDEDKNLTIPARENFREFWEDHTPKKYCLIYGWDANPWVLVIEFRRISKQEAEKAGWTSERTD